MELASALETVVYRTTENEEETRRFYRELLELQPFGEQDYGHRLPTGVFLLFNRDKSTVQDCPPPHGAAGPVHTCFLAGEGEYERWKDELSAKGVEIVKEIQWERGPRSFYFEDPAGNLLEIAEGDMWPA